MLLAVLETMASFLQAYKGICVLCMYIAHILIIYALLLKMGASPLKPVCKFNVINEFQGTFTLRYTEAVNLSEENNRLKGKKARLGRFLCFLTVS